MSDFAVMIDTLARLIEIEDVAVLFKHPCKANVIVELEGHLYTPPVRCGLLAGTYRQRLLDEERISERIITVADLRRCSRVLLINSVRKKQSINLDLSILPVLPRG